MKRIELQNILQHMDKGTEKSANNNKEYRKGETAGNLKTTKSWYYSSQETHGSFLVTHYCTSSITFTYFNVIWKKIFGTKVG